MNIEDHEHENQLKNYQIDYHYWNDDKQIFTEYVCAVDKSEAVQTFSYNLEYEQYSSDDWEIVNVEEVEFD